MYFSLFVKRNKDPREPTRFHRQNTTIRRQWHTIVDSGEPLCLLGPPLLLEEPRAALDWRSRLAVEFVAYDPQARDEEPPISWRPVSFVSYAFP